MFKPFRVNSLWTFIKVNIGQIFYFSDNAGQCCCCCCFCCLAAVDVYTYHMTISRAVMWIEM